jgi:hypothetical protein
MRWLTVDFRKKIAITFIMAMALPAVCGAIELDLPGLTLKYGKLERNRDVTKTFETLQILSDYNYYIYGWGSIPYAIIAIEKKFKLRKGLWKKVDITIPLLRGWVQQMDMVYGYPPYGSRILDHKGNPVGMWYSSKQWTTVVIEEGNQIAVFAPEPPGFRGGH